MIRRARPLLGTLVEVRTDADHATVSRAFDAVQAVHRLMSFQEPTSELSRLNREAWRRPLAVHRWTWRVVAAAQWLHRHSAGAFDCSLAGEDAAGMDGVELLPGGRIRFTRRIRLDLGGIAKGFAVDRAIDVLRRRANRAVVNAGGDLRVFGPDRETVAVRDPDCPQRQRPIGRLGDGALATSAPYFSRTTAGWSVRDPLAAASPERYRSVSVLAPTCLRADALTKVVWIHGVEACRPLLQRLKAEAITL